MIDWITELELPQTLQILDGLSAQIAAQFPDAPQVQLLGKLVAEKNYEALVKYQLDYLPLSMDDVPWVAAARQILGFYQKLENLELGVDKENFAFRKWCDAEERCRQTNLFFLAVASGTATLMPDFARVLYAARAKIATVLGKCPAMADLALSFGPGATTSVHKKNACPQAKLAETPTCSENLLRSGAFSSFVRSVPHWLDCHEESTRVDEEGYEVSLLTLKIEKSRLVFVPKNALTYRTIMLQPTLDTMLQKGIGECMAVLLKRAGVDIRDQQKNRNLAGAGSLPYDSPECELATMDLSSASDLISYQLVKFLLPADWFALLCACRPSEATYSLEKFVSTYRLEQFSAMGNGFTFPLETLIFYALMHANMRTKSCTTDQFNMLSCYGDDIIVPSTMAVSSRYILEAAGFLVNTGKTFVSGPFRESCGADYLWGCDIRPYYQKTQVTGETLFTLHNFFFRRGFYDLANTVKSHIPECLVLLGPDGYGDGHLLSENYPMMRSRRIRRSGWAGHLFETYRKIGRTAVSLYPGDYVTPLYTIYLGGSKDDDFSEVIPMRPRSVLRTLLRDTVRGWALRSYDRGTSTPTFFADEEHFRFCMDLPGFIGYERMSIYTLS